MAYEWVYRVFIEAFNFITSDLQLYVFIFKSFIIGVILISWLPLHLSGRIRRFMAPIVLWNIPLKILNNCGKTYNWK